MWDTHDRISKSYRRTGSSLKHWVLMMILWVSQIRTVFIFETWTQYRFSRGGAWKILLAPPFSQATIFNGEDSIMIKICIIVIVLSPNNSYFAFGRGDHCCEGMEGDVQKENGKQFGVASLVCLPHPLCTPLLLHPPWTRHYCLCALHCS